MEDVVVDRESQQRVRVEKECLIRGYDFLGFVSEFNGVKTKLKLHCRKHTLTWETTNINSFFRGSGCLECGLKQRSIKRTKSGDSMIESFKATGSLDNITVFRKLSEKKGHSRVWEYECAICSGDEYVKAGLCSGVFRTTDGLLQRGALSCRCSKNYLWNSAQREYQINKIIKDDCLNLKFIKWVEGKYSNNMSRMILCCAEHGEWESRFANFKNGRRCPDCAINGYKKSENGWLYVLKVQGEYSRFTGYGITNEPDIRLKAHMCNFIKNGFNITETTLFCTTGEDAHAAELFIKHNFELVPQNVEGFIREATHYDRYDAVVSAVKEILPYAVVSKILSLDNYQF